MTTTPSWHSLSRQQANILYDDAMRSGDREALRDLCRRDLFFLLAVACMRKDMQSDWVYDRCREVEASPDGHLDLWFREGYKSTIITYGKTIQDILNDPDITIGIFSHTRPIAKGFLSQIKREFENNTFLKSIFDDILYADPRRSAPKWSIDDGIRVKTKSNSKENTIEAWGLVDGQPTSKHYKLLVYDDVVTLESVTTPEQINKVTTAWEMSLNLGARGGARRYVGTRYHFNDTYKVMMERGSAIPRIKPATDNGKIDGESVFLTRPQLTEKRRDMGPYVFSCQMLQNPVADKAMGFDPMWPMYYDHLKNTRGWNFYILVDPASKKKKTNDYTVMFVIGLAPDGNYYLVDGLRDRLNLTERAAKLFYLHHKWRPQAVGYEEYGLQADIEHIEYEQEHRNYRFKITKLSGSMPKEDRIRRLIPIFEQSRFYLPHILFFVDQEKTPRDLVQEFISQEFTAFPVAVHDDMLDCMARIVDTELGATFPELMDIDGSITAKKTSMNVAETDFDYLE